MLHRTVFAMAGVVALLAGFGCTQHDTVAPVAHDPTNGLYDDAGMAGSSLGPGGDPNLNYGSNPREGTGMPEKN